jgi:hypothetical protein
MELEDIANGVNTLQASRQASKENQTHNDAKIAYEGLAYLGEDIRRFPGLEQNPAQTGAILEDNSRKIPTKLEKETLASFDEILEKLKTKPEYLTRVATEYSADAKGIRKLGEALESENVGEISEALREEDKKSSFNIYLSYATHPQIMTVANKEYMREMSKFRTANLSSEKEVKPGKRAMVYDPQKALNYVQGLFPNEATKKKAAFGLAQIYAASKQKRK